MYLRHKDIICYCKEINRETIQKAIDGGAKTLGDIKDETGACTGKECETKNPSGKCCADDIKDILKGKLTCPGCTCGTC